MMFFRKPVAQTAMSVCGLLIALGGDPVAAHGAPIVERTAVDQPIQMPSGEQLPDELKQFDVQRRSFNYTRQESDQNAFATKALIKFDSPVNSPYPQNNIVPAELYLPRNATGKVRAVIVLDTLKGNGQVARMMANYCCMENVAALYVPFAYYNERCPDQGQRMNAFTAEALRQTVMDIRRAKCILASLPEIDSDHIGIVGISFGGIVASLAAGVDGTFDRVVLVLAGGNLADLVMTCPEMVEVWKRMRGQGVTPEQLRKHMECVEPIHFASRIGPKRCLMIIARQDEIIPRKATDSLCDAIGKPERISVDSGHQLPPAISLAIAKKAVEFLQG